MKTTVEPRPSATSAPDTSDEWSGKEAIRLVVEIDEQEFDRSIDAAYRKIAQEVRVPGFRPGKAPRRLLAKMVGEGAARQQALQDSLPEYYMNAVTAEGIDVIDSPRISITSGEDGGPIAFEAIVEVRPKVRVPGYDGLAVTVASPDVTDAEVDAQVDRMRGAFATMWVVDRQAMSGDHVRIDIAGSVDGEQQPSLTAEDYVYEVGSAGVVPELDHELLGASAGDSLNFDARIPDAPADDEGIIPHITFAVTVKQVNEKVLPEATDEWAASASEFSTLAEMRADMAKRIGQIKRLQTAMSVRDEAVKALVELMDGDAPDTLVDGEIERRFGDLQERLGRQGASLEQYLMATGQPIEEIRDTMREGAIQSVKADLALRAVADAEGIEAEAAEIDAEIARLATRFSMKPKQVRSNLERSYQLATLAADVRKSKALTWLSEHAQIVDPDGKTIDRELLKVDAAALAAAEDEAELGVDSSVDVHDDGEDHVHDHADHDHDDAGHDHAAHTNQL
jgi:trigger factor